MIYIFFFIFVCFKMLFYFCNRKHEYTYMLLLIIAIFKQSVRED